MSLCVQAQQENKELALAEDLFARNYFGPASVHYIKLIASDSGNPELNYRLGICYLASRSQKYKAIKYLKKAIEVTGAFTVENKGAKDATSERYVYKEPTVPLLTYKLLADAYYSTSRFEEAMIIYEKFKKLSLESKNNDLILADEVNWKIELCKMGKELISLKELVGAVVTNKYAKTGNTQSLENISGSVAPPDRPTMRDSFYKTEDPDAKSADDHEYYEDQYSPPKDLYPIRDPQKDTVTRNYETHIATSVDGHIILLYKDEHGEGNLYASGLNGNNWSEPEKLCKPLNPKGWEINEFISADGSEMYFSSDRKGGYGGRDIYKCGKMTNGEWGKATNLGPVINSPYDEEAPCIHPNRKTLYFSSNKYENAKTFEIFASNLTDTGTWTNPVNVSYPTESASSTNEDLAHKAGGPSVNGSKEAVNERENYIATFLNHEKTALTIIKGRIIDKEEKIPGHLEITVSDNESGGVMGTYRPGNVRGQYLFVLPSNRNNNVTYEADGYLFYSENMNIVSERDRFKISSTVLLEPVEPGAHVILNNIFFDSARASLNSASTIELNTIFRFLQKNQGVAVEIICDINTTENLENLSKERAETIMNYLVGKGIEKRRIIAKGKWKNLAKKKHKKKDKIEEMPSQKIELRVAELSRKNNK